jgi:predicted RNA-binding protein with TRAM domain
VLAEGKLEELRPEAPMEEGKQIELKLVELGLHDAHAAVGKLDGHDVVVGGAAKLVGKKAKVRIERVFDGVAYAALLSGGDKAPEPITFESEAEKPTRAPSRAKKPAEETVDETVEAEVADVEAGVVELEDDETVAEVDSDETAATDGAPKKKTRRGSRGGRKRKPAAAATETAGEAEAESEAPREEAAEAPKRRAPRIHVPTTDLGEPAKEPRSRPKPARAQPAAAEPAAAESAVAAGLELEADKPADLDPETGEPKPKKKTRRGSRGGRNRKRKPAAAAAGENGAEPTAEAEAEGEVDLELEPVEAVRTPDDNGRPEEQQSDDGRSDDYVPMSEWLDDIESGDRR